MKFIKQIFKKQKGQALTEFILIAAFVGLVMAVASTDLFDGVKNNYYKGMLPLSDGADIPELPEGGGGGSKYKPPIAKIGGPTTAHLGETVVFTDESYDVDGKIVGSTWGTKTISRTFMELGQHLIKLEVVDNSGLRSQVELIVTVGNSEPTAIITFNPESEIFEGDGVSVSGSNSRDGDGHSLAEWEWHMTGPDGNREFRSWPLSGYTFKPGELKQGQYKFELIVTDKYQTASQPAVRTLEIKPPPNQPPLAVITMNPESNIDSATVITWSHENSTDPDGDKIVDAEWKNKLSTYAAGTHIVELRVKDEKGAWSSWVKKTITVSEFIFYDKNFDFTGSMQTFTVPHTGRYKLELWGAQGGGSYDSSYPNNALGGLGGYATGEIDLTAGQVLYVYVGGKGGYWTNGGFNGGGAAGQYGGSGGGATDVRIGGTALNNRKIVAAGGGGASGGSHPANGGNGGGLTGGHNYSSYSGTAYGGSQTAGGTVTGGYNGSASGTFGQGAGSSTYHWAGAGGGWYGGGASGAIPAGGGSSYIGGVLNGNTDSGVRTGNGYAKITRVKNSPPLTGGNGGLQPPVTNPTQPTPDVQPPTYEY